jgi:hypothetical protein
MALSLRVALAGENPQQAENEEPTVVMTGPLAEIFRKALNVAYANDDPVTGQPTLESQAQDAQIAQLLREALLKEEERDLAPLTVYGVSRVDATMDNLQEVAQQAIGRPSDEIFVLVSDYTQPGPNGESGGGSEEYLPIAVAMESMVKGLGGHVVHSLEDLKTLCKAGFR